MKNLSTKRGFTLIEILIALSIFSVVLMMTTGIVGQSAGFQSKIEAQKETFQATRSINDMIATDIRSANTGGEIEADVNIDPSPILSRQSKTYPSGLAVFDCKTVGADDKCLFVHFQNSDNGQESILSNHVDGMSLQTAVDFKGNTIVIEKKIQNTANKTVIVYNLNDKKLYRNTLTLAQNDPFELTDSLPAIRLESNQISDKTLEVEALKIGGYIPDDQGMLAFPLQPYVSYYLKVQTKGYDNLIPVFRGQSEIATTVASRNY